MSRCFQDAIPKHTELSPPPAPRIKTFHRSGLYLGGGWVGKVVNIKALAQFILLGD